MIVRIFAKKYFLIAATFITILFGSLPAHANPLLINFNPTTFTVTPGQIGVDVFGTLTNTSAETIYLNGDNLTIPAAENIMDYFINTPLSLDAGQDSGLIKLFSFDVLATAVPGVVSGSYSIFGGTANDSWAFDLLGSQSFLMTVQTGETPVPPTTAPEPYSMVLLALGLAGVARLHISRKTV